MSDTNSKVDFSYIPDDKIELIRELINKLVGGKHLQYAEIAQATGTDIQALKNFAYGKTKKPRRDFLTKVYNNTRKLKMYRLGTEIDNLVNEILKGKISDEHPLFVFLSDALGVSSDEFAECASKIEGEYACYRHGSGSSEIFKTHLQIHPYDEAHKTPRFSLTHYMVNGQPNRAVGIVVPHGQGLYLLGKVVSPRGFVTISIDNAEGTFLNGMLTLSMADRTTFSTRILIKKVPPVPKNARAKTFGIKILDDELRKELGPNGEDYLSNHCTSDGLLRNFKIR